MLKFHNTLSRKIEEFQPLTDGQVRMYTCGPTVHNYIHIGNLRTFIFEDLLRRTLKHLGYQVTQVMNITDIDDKTIKGSQAQGITLNEFTAPYIQAFFDDLKILNIEPAEVYPRATEHIPEMVVLVERLAAKGLTYDAEDGIYFPIARFSHYGLLSGFDINQVKVGARVSQDQYDKEDARDFALWKKEKPGEPAWDAPFGRGRPGWHIECSAMSMKYLGETFDIHTGGVDNIFPHHENEIAQSEGATGKPLARYWLHSEHLMIEGEKMAKSLHNFYTLKELLDKGYAPMAIRYLLLSTHYRKRLSFTYQGLEGAQSVIRRFSDLKLRLIEVIQDGGKKKGDKPLSAALGAQKQAFDSALEDDLSISPALAAVFEVVRVANISLEEGTISAKQAQSVLEFLAMVDKVLGIMGPRVFSVLLETQERTKPTQVSEITRFDQAEERLPQEILDLVEQREQARQEKNYQLADELRKKIESQGYLLEDTPQRVRVKRG